MIVLKFGGTSVGSPESIKQLRIILESELSKGNKLAVVASAFSGVTNSLEGLGEKAAAGDISYTEDLQKLRNKHVDFCRDLEVNNISVLDDWFKNLQDALHGVYLVREFSARLRDFVMSFGERFSCRIISAYLQENRVPCAYLDARELIRTDDRFGAARVAFDETKRNISEALSKLDSIAMITGFIGSTEKGETTTLGRGGSDYTAAITGAAVSAHEVQIWTDVDGVMTADPRKVPDAFSLSAITYAEAMELSHFGAKVLYAPTIQPLLEAQIPIRIMNTFRPEFKGTLINGKSLQEDQPVRGITSVPKAALVLLQGSGMIGVPGTAGRLFSCLARNEINILLISQASSEHSICLAIMPGDILAAQRAIWREFQYEIAAGSIDEPSVETDCAIVSVVGDKMRHLPGLSGELFSALGKEGINVKVIAQGSSERNISIVIAAEDELSALNCIHSRFFQQANKLNLFMIGTGLIGRELLSQLATNHKNELTPNIQLRGIANSRQMTFGHIGLGDWEETLMNSTRDSVLENFVEEMLRIKASNSVFLDCTGSDIAIPFYESILTGGVSIVTPNKKACSGPYAVYNTLKHVSRKGGCFFYETNVGAGLPVIRTLQDLIATGDSIQRIEGVLSGTLSYLFNTFKEGQSFSRLVRDAREKGFTEPDPREDLNGQDVARKILILARECGLTLEPEDIVVENLVPESCRDEITIDAFFEALAKEDALFEKRRADAASNGERLSYIATLNDGKVDVALRSIPSSHPFYSLQGSDNVIAFTTGRYSASPLVIRGAGAGAAVTAAGVFTDILRVAAETGVQNNGKRL